jgi:hypothetical protein
MPFLIYLSREIFPVEGAGVCHHPPSHLLLPLFSSSLHASIDLDGVEQVEVKSDTGEGELFPFLVHLLLVVLTEH